MSYSSWAIPDRTSGSGNQTVNWTGQEHTGRVQRQTTAIFSANGVSDVTLVIKQTGKTEFVSIDSSAAVSKSGASAITVEGASNSKKLTFALNQNGIGLTLPAKYSAGGAQTNNGANIEGDPGAAQQYAFSIQFENVPENGTISERTSQLVVTDEAGHTATCTIRQAAGEAALSISPMEITLSAAGAPAVSVAVTSNTSWAIS